ncbi:MAG: hypothetical protein AAGC68_06015, partial [Verrucomicrobiota bacterium]
VAERQNAIRLLPKMGGNEFLEELVAEVVSGELDPALHLDVFETAKDPAFGDDITIVEPVAELEADWLAEMAANPLAPFEVATYGGDPVRGKSVFLNHAAAQCIRCHKIEDGKGSNVGPNLKEIGKKRDAAYLLESLVDPQRTIAKGYGNISLTLTDGSNVAGQFRDEKNGKVFVRDADNKVTQIHLEKIKERSPVVSTMPPMGFILTKEELRDVMAFLMALRGES